MHTQTFQSFGEHFRARRLLSLRGTSETQTRAEEVLDQAQATRGAMNRRETVDQALQGRAQKLADGIGEMTRGWGAWLNHFCSGGSAIDDALQRRIREAAEREIRDVSDLETGRIAGLVLRSKRKLYLSSRARIEEKIREEMAAYLRKDFETAQERFGRYSGLVDMLKGQHGELKLTAKEQGMLQASLERLKKKNVREMNATTSAEVTETQQDWESARATEQVVIQQLRTLKIIPGHQLKEYLERNRRREDTALIDLVKRLVTDKPMRQFLVRALRELRKGESRYAAVADRMTADPNAGGREDRLKFLKNDTHPLLRTLRIDVRDRTVDADVIHREADGWLLMENTTIPGQYFCLDPESGTVFYRDGANRTQEIVPQFSIN